MELTFIAGVRAGEHLHLTEPVISIGRELDNLVLMPVEGVSRHHAEIRLTAPEEWELRDLGSANGVKLNRRKITGPTPLHDGDIIEICEQSIMVNLKPPMGTVIFKPLNEMAATLSAESAARRAVPADYDTPVPAPSPGATTPLLRRAKAVGELTQAVQSGQVELFNGPSGVGSPKPPAEFSPESENAPRTPGARRFSNHFFYILVFVVAVVVICAFLLYMRGAEAPAEAPAPVVEAAPTLVMLYERERIDNDNVFRYSLLFENNQATFVLDDLRSRRSFRQVIPEVSMEAQKALLAKMEQNGFFELDEAPGGAQSVNGQQETRHILVVTPERRHEVTVRNDMPPEAFAFMEDWMQNFAEDNDLQTISLTPEELKDQAEKAYRSAENYFANYSGNPANLPLAIRNYELAAQYLEQFAPKPEIYRNAMAQLEKLRGIRDDRIKALKIEIQNLSQLRDFPGLRLVLLEMKDLAEPGSRDAENARKGLLTVEEQLRTQQRR